MSGSYHFLLRAIKVIARSPTAAKVPSNPGVVLVVVVDLVVLAGSGAGVVLVVVVVDLVALGPGSELVVIVVDLTVSDVGVVLVTVIADFVSSAAAIRDSSSIVAISTANNIFFISNLHSSTQP